jgi:cold shock CspA family protein
MLYSNVYWFIHTDSYTSFLYPNIPDKMSTNDNTDPVTIPAPIPPPTRSSNGRAPLLPTDYTVLVERLTGTVKWFNNRAGFGFITVCEPGEYENKEIFVHWSSIRVSNSQYKYLFQGEYVDFTLVKVNHNNHEYQAMNVSGVKGGPIMCETRRALDHGGNYRRRPRDSTEEGDIGGAGGATGRRPPPRIRGPPHLSSSDDYRPSRRGPRNKPSATDSRPKSAGDEPTQDSALLDYVKVQSKRTRKTAAKTA